MSGQEISLDLKTIDLADLTHVLGKLDIYVPGLSYDETAQKIWQALPRTSIAEIDSSEVRSPNPA